MEIILLGQPIKTFVDINSYIEEVRKLDAVLSDKIVSMLRMRNSIGTSKVTA